MPTQRSAPRPDDTQDAREDAQSDAPTPTAPRPLLNLDYGHQILRLLHRRLGLEPERSTWTPHGFRYAVNGMTVDIYATPPWTPGGLWALTARLPYAGPVDANARATLEALDSLHATLPHFTAVVARDALVLRTHARIQPGGSLETLAHFFHRVGLMVFIATDHLADSFLEDLASTGSAPVRRIPDPDVHTIAPESDPIPNLLHTFYAHMQTALAICPPERTPDFGRAEAYLRNEPDTTIEPHAKGAEDTVTAYFAADGKVEHGTVGYLSLVRNMHLGPFGEGLFAFLWIPNRQGSGREADLRLAQALNEAELHHDLPMQGHGVWTTAPDDGAVMYRVFYPNATLKPDLATEIAAENHARFDWAMRHVLDNAQASPDDANDTGDLDPTTHVAAEA